MRLLQPWREDLSPEYVAEVEALGLWANVFYANTTEEMRKYWRPGLRGILTDNPEAILGYLQSARTDRAEE